MKNWTELENSSFFDANARERALGMVDKGTFTEFLNPLDRYCSPHLPVLGTAFVFAAQYQYCLGGHALQGIPARVDIGCF